MPGLTITTDSLPASISARGTAATPRRGTSTTSPTTRTSSPPRPPVIPITPTLGPTQLRGGPTATTTTTTNSNNNNNNDTIPNFALGRPAFTHATQAEQVGIAPPAAQPIDFDDNPDVLALKSAISILQLQRARATADIQSLNRVKKAALADTEAFVADLAAGRVRVEGDPLFSGPGNGVEDDDDDDDDDDEGEDENEQHHDDEGQTPDRDTPMTDDTEPAPSRKTKPNRKGKQRAGGAEPPLTNPAWRKLPKPQTVVRCPPINWAQYGVVGESLDKLHAEQVAAPNPGAPAVLGGGGTFEFRAGDQAAAAAGGEQARRLVGIAAPYAPGRDKLEKKGKGGKR